MGGLESIYVRSFTFAGKANTIRRISTPFRAQFQTAAWSRIVGVRSREDGDNVDVFLKAEANGQTRRRGGDLDAAQGIDHRPHQRHARSRPAGGPGRAVPHSPSGDEYESGGNEDPMARVCSCWRAARRPAADRDFDRVVKAIESHYGTRHTHVPLMGAGQFLRQGGAARRHQQFPPGDLRTPGRGGDDRDEFMDHLDTGQPAPAGARPIEPRSARRRISWPATPGNRRAC